MKFVLHCKIAEISHMYTYSEARFSSIEMLHLATVPAVIGGVDKIGGLTAKHPGKFLGSCPFSFRETWGFKYNCMIFAIGIHEGGNLPIIIIVQCSLARELHAERD